MMTVLLICRTAKIVFQLLAVLGIAFGHLLDGTVLAYTATALPSLKADNSTFEVTDSMINMASK